MNQESATQGKPPPPREAELAAAIIDYLAEHPRAMDTLVSDDEQPYGEDLDSDEQPYGEGLDATAFAADGLDDEAAGFTDDEGQRTSPAQETADSGGDYAYRTALHAGHKGDEGEGYDEAYPED